MDTYLKNIVKYSPNNSLKLGADTKQFLVDWFKLYVKKFIINRSGHTEVLPKHNFKKSQMDIIKEVCEEVGGDKKISDKDTNALYKELNDAYTRLFIVCGSKSKLTKDQAKLILKNEFPEVGDYDNSETPERDVVINFVSSKKFKDLNDVIAFKNNLLSKVDVLDPEEYKKEFSKTDNLIKYIETFDDTSDKKMTRLLRFLLNLKDNEMENIVDELVIFILLKKNKCNINIQNQYKENFTKIHKLFKG